MRISTVLSIVLVALGPVSAAAQAVTAQDYTRAEQFLRANTAPLVYQANVDPQFLPDDRFWYRNTVPTGHRFVLIDPTARTRSSAFDHAGVARALSAVSDTTYEANQLPFITFEYSPDGGAITFEVGSQRYTCDVNGNRCTERPRDGANSRNAVVSPNGRLAAFIRDHNLWVRDVSSDESWAVTTDGVEHFGYAGRQSKSAS